MKRNSLKKEGSQKALRYKSKIQICIWNTNYNLLPLGRGVSSIVVYKEEKPKEVV